MPTPNPVMPKTHSFVVDVNQIIVNIQRAATYVLGAGEPRRQRPEQLSPSEQNKCHIGTLGELRVFLQPALEAQWVQYSKKSYKEKSVHILEYAGSAQDRQHILLMPTTIQNTLSNADCSIDPGLAYYLGAGLDITPPFSAQDATAASMVGYIRCFGSGVLDCPQFMDFAPPVAPAAPPVPSVAAATPTAQETELADYNIQELFEALKKGNAAPKEYLKTIYLRRAATFAMKLAQDVRQVLSGDAATEKKLSELVAQNEKILAQTVGKYDAEESNRISGWLQQFFNALFQATAGESLYNRFRGNLSKMGCTETKEATTGNRHVACPAHKLQFDIIRRTNTMDQASKTVAK